MAVYPTSDNRRRRLLHVALDGRTEFLPGVFEVAMLVEEFGGTGGQGFVHYVRRTGEHEDRNLETTIPQLADELSAGHLAHAVVGDKDIGPDIQDVSQGFFSGGKGGDLAFRVFEGELPVNEKQEVGIVIGQGKMMNGHDKKYVADKGKQMGITRARFCYVSTGKHTRKALVMLLNNRIRGVRVLEFVCVMVELGIILLVDDSPDDTELVRLAFKKAEIENPLKTVASGEEAMVYVRGTGKYANREEYPLPELILLDSKMPGVDGFEVLSWLKREPGLSKIPVVVLTSSEQMKDVNRAYELGANSFLVKPFDFDD